MSLIESAKHRTRQMMDVSARMYREVTSPMRRLPDFLIIGAQRCGTTSLYFYLSEHPNVVSAATKEVHFFDDRYDKGMGWYRAQFPTSVYKYLSAPMRRYGFLTGEATPSYLFHPYAPKRISQALPRAKLIVILRNPVDRAYSQYWLRSTVSDETLSFEDALRTEEERIAAERQKLETDERQKDTFRRYSYLTRGIYVDQLQHWMSYYPKEQFFILRSEDFYKDPSTIVRQTLEFIGAPNADMLASKEFKQYRTAQKTGYLYDQKPPKMKPETRAYLVDYFKPHNARLYEFLGRDFGWDK